jgi:dipeptidase E
MVLQVIAMGGYEIAGPSGPPSVLERYLFEAAGMPKPRVCFLATATGDHPMMLARFYEICETLPSEPAHLALFQDRDVEDLEAFLDGFDVIYVAGGNTASMLAVWRAHGLDRALALRAAARDCVVGGASAGGMCWFDAGYTMSYGPLTPLHDGLGWFPGSFNPHAQQPGRLDAYAAAVADESVPPGWALDDGAALHYVDGRLGRAVRAAEDARVHAVNQAGAKLVESELIV